jgi:outer membrane beta-barrel protein
MKARYRAALLVSAFVSFLPLSAHAEVKKGSTEVNLFGGYNWFEHDQNLKDRPMVGGRVGYNFSKHLGVEGVIEYIDSHVDDRKRTGLSEGQFGSPIASVDLTFYHIDAIYHFLPDEQFTPFVVLGVGGAHYNPDISTNEMAAFTVGVGAKYRLTDRLSLRADLRDYLVTEIMQESYHNLGATMGISYAFGGEEEAPTQAAQEDRAEAAPEPPAVVIMAAEPKAEEQVAAAAVEPKIIILAFEDVHFEFDQSSLTPTAKTILKRNIQLLRETPNAQIRIAGYTSRSGTEEYNQRLSEQRSNAVKAYLVDEGLIAADRLSTVGYGESKPAVHEVAPKELYSAAAKANMRVLFVEVVVK